MDLINESNGKINKIIIKFISTGVDNKELYQSICMEHNQLQQKLKQLLNVASLPSQQQTTSSALI
jgi:alkylhydroperoxidase/carboxymuconolactone decarboxylase family protein YurZ